MTHGNGARVAAEERERLVERLDIDDSVADEELTLSTLRAAVDGEIDDEFVSMGEAIRSDLEGSLDVALLESVMADLETQIARLPEVREAGIPDGEREPERLYRELIEPAWRMYDHLVDVGFFESVDANAPRFSSEHIRNTSYGLLEADPLTSELESIGFDDAEQLRLVTSVVNSDKELARWVPTEQIPRDVEFNVDFVPPLHQRAAGGSLLWIRTLDVHLWQKQVLITEEILDDGYWDIKAMLGGLYLLTRAAREIGVGDESALTDGQLMAALTASAAIMIINQQEICRDMYYITEEMRAPPKAR
ncbi:hypothetical protein SAMN04487948_10791 [Halogranum amylolyticum]|uniref:Uncharacterized protein n=1 Tax=Halogranum amylolyticum TaxID=660520 RepID=A0A1H8TIC6_9EURY|nr:hypothetical protein [Halogranum amylolyticum]SEO90850.1 hypothetical protein SAMN04487948_10791 [Halogranum amylolyticum]